MFKIIIFIILMMILSGIAEQNKKLQDSIDIIIKTQSENSKSYKSIDMKLQGHYDRINNSTEHLVNELKRIQETSEVEYE